MRFGFIPFLLFIVCPAVRANEPDLTVRLSVAPAAAPSPALRFALLPEVRETSPGNAALLYYRTFSPEWLTHRRPDTSKKLDEWRMDTRRKPGNDLRWVLHYHPLEEMDRAARRAYCDWEMTERARKEGVGMMLPDVQAMREFASLLALKARFQIEAGEHDRVLRTIQTSLTLGRHVADAPTLIQALVGMAICQITLEEVQRWIEKPGAPNLYWSLTALPTPFVDIRKPMQGERLLFDSLVPGLREALKERKPELFPVERMRSQLREIALVMEHRWPYEDNLALFSIKLSLAGYVAKVYPEARKTIREYGWTEKEIDALPVTTAALMQEVIKYDRAFDDLFKWYGLPTPVARQGIARVTQNLGAAHQSLGAGSLLARLLLPAVDKVMLSGVRLDRRIAILRCVEALRLHAAAHDGKFPESLADITEVPVPADPLTGKPFEYQRDGDKARLNGPPPAGEQPHVNNSMRYEITIRK